MCQRKKSIYTLGPCYVWGYTHSLEVWICAFSHAALALFQKRLSQGNLSHVQQTICSGDKFPTLLRALLSSASLIRPALNLLQFRSRAAMVPRSYASSWVWNSRTSASVSGTRVQDAISDFCSWQAFSELRCHSLRNMHFVGLLTQVMGVQSSLLLWIILPDTNMFIQTGKNPFSNQPFHL